jgi:hypothetical protein
MPIIKGGRGNYGEAVGILTLDTVFPRIPGDVGNATTFDFPVRFSVVRGASPKRVVHEQDPALLKPFVEAAQELEAAGCRAITTTCGFLALFQKEMAAAVGVPLFTSSLLQVPIVYRMLQPGQVIGILTAHSDAMNPRVLEAVGPTGCRTSWAARRSRRTSTTSSSRTATGSTRTSARASSSPSPRG